MSIAKRYRLQAARFYSTADRLNLKGNCAIFEHIVRNRALVLAKRAATAGRWETMANTPLAERPGGFPGDPFNCRKRVNGKA